MKPRTASGLPSTSMKGGTSCDTAAGKPIMRVRADLDELVDAGEAAHRHPVAQLHVAGQRGVVGQGRVVADHAVVRDVGVGHDPVVVADARSRRLVLHRADVAGAELADGVAVADHQLAGLALRTSCPGWPRPASELEDAVVAADGGVALDHACAARPWCRRRSSRAGRSRVYGPDGRRERVDLAPSGRRWPWDGSASCATAVQATVRMVHISSASQASSSPTRATPLNL